MNRNSTLLGVCFAAGVLGGLVSSIVAWLAGITGVTALAGVALAPDFTLEWLYPRLVWGGLWGLVYYFAVSSPRIRRRWVRKGLWVSLLPTLAQLFYFFPYQADLGPMGIGLGQLTGLFVVIYNLVWGFVTGFFTRLLWGRG